MGQVNSKYKINTQTLKKKRTNKQQKDGCFLSSNPSRAFVQNGDVPVKTTVLPGISSEGQEKQSCLKSRTESFYKPLGYCILGYVRPFKGMVSIQNL